MKAFITGATGFVGHQVVRRLARAGHELRCLVRPGSAVGELEELGVTLVQGDVTDKESVRAGMRECDWVVHLANLYSFWEPDPQAYDRVNVQGTRNVMESALAEKVSKVVHVSSVVVYGKPQQVPFSEESPAGPRRFSRYAQSKYEGDVIAWGLHDAHGLPLVMVYPGAVLGPGDPKATGQYIRDLLQGRLPAKVFPGSRLTFVHVRDVAEVIARALAKKDNAGSRYFACAQALSFAELNEMIRSSAGVPLPKLTLPGWLATANAALLTTLARLTGKPPLWGLSSDQVRTMRHGFVADGGKAARELGIEYTPVRAALEEAIAALRRKA